MPRVSPFLNGLNLDFDSGFQSYQMFPWGHPCLVQKGCMTFFQ